DRQVELPAGHVLFCFHRAGTPGLGVPADSLVSGNFPSRLYLLALSNSYPQQRGKLYATWDTPCRDVCVGIRCPALASGWGGRVQALSSHHTQGRAAAYAASSTDGHTDHRPNRDRGGNHHTHNDGHDYADWNDHGNAD